VLHVAGFYVFLHVKFTYKIYKYKEKAADVILLPKEYFRFPTNAKQRTETAGPRQPLIIKPGHDIPPAGPAPKAAGQTSAQGPPSQPAAGPEAQRLPIAGSGVESPQATSGEGGTSGALASGFSLIYPSNARLSLAKPSENSLEELLKPSRYQARPDINFSKYVRPGISPGIPAGGGIGSAGGKGSGGQARGASVSLNVMRYDLSPWADEVMNKIQKNWSIAQTGYETSKGEVGISVLITKNGELLAVEIESASKIDVLDQAALDALRLSAPFPPLPADFPNSSLELYFVFQYGY
jgi:TonB family protein